MAAKEKANYELPNDQRELEERLDNDRASDRVLSTSDAYDPGEVPEDEPGYVGVDPIYQNAANKTEEPYRSEEGAQADLEDELLGEDNTSHEDNEGDDDNADKSSDGVQSAQAGQSK